MLKVENVHTYRGHSYVLQGVSLEAAEDACTVILGRNGMGKTTLVRTIMGMDRAHAGRIVYDGQEITHRPVYQNAAAGIGLVPQGRMIFPSLTVEENLVMCMPRGGGSGWSLDQVYAEFPHLARRRRNWGNQLSGGEQQMLAIARVLVAGSRLILMDEPSEGLGPAIVNQVGDLIAQIREHGTTVILVEQNYRLAMRSADVVNILVSGKVAWTGTPEELDGSEELRSRYLGLGAAA